jgi:hypothetical protein
VAVLGDQQDASEVCVALLHKSHVAIVKQQRGKQRELEGKWVDLLKAITQWRDFSKHGKTAGCRLVGARWSLRRAAGTPSNHVRCQSVSAGLPSSLSSIFDSSVG